MKNYDTEMIVTIDGPAGSGKSTAARELAARIGFEFLDTGAMYRAVAYHCRAHGIDLDNHPQVAEHLAEVHIDMPGGQVLLNGKDVSREIRSSEMAAGASKVAAIEAVRSLLVQHQRAIAVGKNLVTEGRDQGTVVFPDAELKVFLVASPEARAERRRRDLLKRGEEVSFEEVLAKQFERDRRDSERAFGPLKPAADALPVDTTEKSIEEVVTLLVTEVYKRCRPG